MFFCKEQDFFKTFSNIFGSGNVSCRKWLLSAFIATKILYIFLHVLKGVALLRTFCSDTFKSTTNNDTFDTTRVSLLVVLLNVCHYETCVKVQRTIGWKSTYSTITPRHHPPVRFDHSQTSALQ